MQDVIIKSLRWLLPTSSLLAVFANIEGSLSLGTRIFKGPILPIPSWAILGLCLVSLSYILWLKYVELKNERVLRIVRKNFIQATQHIDSMSRLIGNSLRNRGEIGRLANLSLEDATNMYSLPLRALVDASEGKNIRSKLLSKIVEDSFINALNRYAKAVHRLRDAGNSISFTFNENGNYREWKRLDSELLKEVKELISQSNTRRIGNLLESNIWRDGIRHDL